MSSTRQRYKQDYGSQAQIATPVQIGDIIIADYSFCQNHLKRTHFKQPSAYATS